MNDIQKVNGTEITEIQIMEPIIPTVMDQLSIIEDGLKKNYLARLTEMPIISNRDFTPLEEDLIDNVRLYKITEMVYQKGESATDKFTTVFNTLSTYDASVFIIMDSDGIKTDFYVGVRNDEQDELLKRSTVTLGDTLKNTLIGHFPGIKIQNEDRFHITKLSEKIRSQKNVASVSVLGNSKSQKEVSNEQFVQGLEKLAYAMQGRQYVGMIVAKNQTPQFVQNTKNHYRDLYTKLSAYQKVQFTEGESTSTSRSKSFTEMSPKQRLAMLGGAAVSVAGSFL